MKFYDTIGVLLAGFETLGQIIGPFTSIVSLLVRGNGYEIK